MARRLAIIALVGFACMCTYPVTAAPLEADNLPRDTKWVIHVDYEAFTESALAERVRTNRPEIVKRINDWFQENCGIDPRNDIHSVTLFSNDYQPHSGAVVFCGDFDEAKVSSMLEQKRAVKQTEAAGHTFYTWTIPAGHEGFKGEHITGKEAPLENVGSVDVEPAHKDAVEAVEDATDIADTASSDTQRPSDSAVTGEDAKKHQHEVTAVLIDGEKAVLAGSVDRAQKVVQLLEGEEPTLKADSKLIEDMADAAFAYGAAIDLQEISLHDRPFPILEQHKRIQWFTGERDDQMFETLVLVADRSKTAREMEKAMEGLIALGKIWAGDLDTLADLYDDTEIERDGSTVTVEWEGSIEDVMTALDELQPRLQAWKQYHEKMHR
jgi:hypothetical protein